MGYRPVRIAGDAIELFSSGPLVCEAVVVLSLAAVVELAECDAVVAVIVLVAAEVGGEWLSLDSIAATCCTIVAISSVINGRVSFPGGFAAGALGWLCRVYGRLEVA